MDNNEKFDILLGVLLSFEENSDLSVIEYLSGEGFSFEEFVEKKDIELIKNILRDFENASLFSVNEYLLGEGYSEEDIQIILGEE